MPVIQAPGVYVFEERGAPPIAGVGTSTAAFIGTVDVASAGFQMPLRPGSDTERLDPAPVNEPRLVTNFDQFKNSFGDFQAGNRILAHSVFGFFLNGGTRCWVTRVDSATNDINTANLVPALEELERIDEIAIVAAPGATNAALQNEIADRCANLGDRFAIIDGQQTTDITVDAITGRTDGQGGVGNSDYAALYFPWVQVVDQTLGPANVDVERRRPLPGARLVMAPSGYIAGIFARVDQARGVHKAPANEVVRGALNLAHLTTRGEQEGLNPAGVNVIRGFNGNIKVWGARTLGGDANGEFRYINVRRLLLFLRESIDEGTQFAVFEPNAPPLWQKIRRSVTGFLTNVWRDGALFGNTPEEAFFVRCDETTNPIEVREIGQVITEIGVAVVKPAEFVIFRISQSAGASA
jgi:phage tail sheath protein FI